MKTRRWSQDMYGFTLVEVLVYGAILAAVSVFVVSSILQLQVAFARARSIRKINEVGFVAMERMIREIRNGRGTENSKITTGGPNGMMTIIKPNLNEITFQLSVGSSQVTVAEGSVVDILTPSGVTVTSLAFYIVCNPEGPFPPQPSPNDGCAEPVLQSEGVRVELTVETGSGKNYMSTTLYGFAMLRDSYIANQSI